MSDEKVTPIRPGIGPIPPEEEDNRISEEDREVMFQNKVERIAISQHCPPHEPFPIHQNWTVQEPGKLIPTGVRIHLCVKCHMVYWINLEVNFKESA